MSVVQGQIVESGVPGNTINMQADTTLTAGVATQLYVTSVATGFQGVTVQASTANTGTIRVAGSTVSGTVGFELTAGNSITFGEIADPSLVYAYAAVSGCVVRIGW